MSQFDPANCQWASWPFIAKPTIAPWSSGNAVGYLQGVLVCKASNTAIYVAPNGPYNFDLPTYNGVKTIQHFFGLPETGVVDGTTWPYIDYLAVH